MLHDLADSVERGGAAGRRADYAHFTGRWRNRNRRSRIERHIGDANECRTRRVALLPEAIGQHAEADDIVRGSEARELLFRDGHPIELTTAPARRTSRGRPRSSTRAPTRARARRSRATCADSPTPAERPRSWRPASRPRTARTRGSRL